MPPAQSATHAARLLCEKWGSPIGERDYELAVVVGQLLSQLNEPTDTEVESVVERAVRLFKGER